MSRAYPTITVLTDHLDYLRSGYASQVCRGLEGAARQAKVQLNYFVGHALGAGPQARVHQLAGSANADGIIVLTAGLASHLGIQAVEELLAPLRHIPLCSLGVELPGIPSVVADNHPGQQALLDHLIRDHDRRRLACITGFAGNPDSAARYQAYRDALERHKIPFDPELLIEGVVETTRAKQKTQELLAKGVHFDALVALNDGVALGALEALSENGTQVPEQVSLTGFDDLTICRFTHPPLTTVRQPIMSMASKAIEIIERAMQGQPTPLLTELDAEPVWRSSCGCQVTLAPLSTRFSLAGSVDLPEWLDRNRELIAARLRQKLDTPTAPDDWISWSLDALARELSGQRGAFVGALEQRMASTPDRIRTYDESLHLVEALRRSFASVATHLEALWIDAERALAVTSVAAQMQNWIAVEVAYHGLLDSGASLSRAFDWSSLKAALGQCLPEQVTSAYISLKASDGDDWLQPFFYLQHGEIVTSDSTRFEAARLVPPDLEIAPRRDPWIVLPLTVEDEYLGIAVLELSGRIGIHEMLRTQISTALKSVSLHQRIVQKTAEHERTMQERLATTKRMESLSVLAGGVAHDLNNALGPLVALPDVILEQLAAVGDSDEAVRADLDVLKGSALRAAQTIKDLFVLGRQGRMPRQPLDIRDFCRGCIEADPSLKDLADQHRAILTLDMSDEPLMISASEGQLQRAVSNLLRNSVEALPPGGSVTLSARTERLRRELDAYETIAAGDYVVIEVRDNGRGIEPDTLGRVFEPFFTNKTPSQSTGSGLGLAIVHGVVKEHAGYVHVESTPDEGTTFRLYFPRIAHSTERRAPRPTPGKSGGYILAVDDDPVQLRTAKRVLAHHGFRVILASSTLEARSYFRDTIDCPEAHEPFDLVLIDMVLGEPEDGLDLFASFQRLRPEQRGLLVSGNAPTQRVEAAMTKGLLFLPKPYRADELVAAVEQALCGTTRACLVG